MEVLDFIYNYICGNKEVLKNIIEGFLNAVMVEEAKQQCGSEYYERGASRKDYRNGFRERKLKSINGTLTLTNLNCATHHFIIACI